MNDTPLVDASWIWKKADRGPDVDVYICFRREWQWEGTDGTEAWVDISADSDFLLCINGMELGRGQFPDHPFRKTWSRFSVGTALRKGTNVIAVLVFYRGEDFSEYARGEGGLLFGLQVGHACLVSDASWKYAYHSGFRSGAAVRVTSQAGYSFQYDARLEKAWTLPGFDDSGWDRVSVIQDRWIGGPVWPYVEKRPLPGLVVGGSVPVRVSSQGRYVQVNISDEMASVAQVMADRALQALPIAQVYGTPDLCRIPESSQPTPEPGEWLYPNVNQPLSITLAVGAGSGWYMVVDLGAEYVGFLTLEVAAKAGTVIEVAHGEHLEDGRVRMLVDERKFADRYICGDGRRSFEMPFRRLGARFLEIHGSGPVQIYRISLRPVESYLRREGYFLVDDPLARRLHETAVRTLELCRHDHFEDCPWRERALYGFDGRLQALFGYYAFGGYQFAEVSLALLGESCGEDGFLALTAPGKRGAVIPGFSFHWICALAEHWLFSGKNNLFKRFQSTIRSILKEAFSRHDPKTGLYDLPEGDDYWHFYEWSKGMTGEQPRPANHAVYQLLLHAAGRSWHWMLTLAGDGKGVEARDLARRLEDLRAAIKCEFAQGDAIASFAPGGSELHEYTQALAVLEGVGDWAFADQSETMIAAMQANEIFLLKATAQASPGKMNVLTGHLQSGWQKMIFSGATSLWETRHGAKDFHGSGSLCHGWSALPVYYHQAFVLGVYPLSPGFREFSLKVYPDRFSHAEGSIPTPHGPIHVKWERKDGLLDITAKGPEICRPLIDMFPEYPVGWCRYNNSEIDLPWDVGAVSAPISG